MWQLGAYFKVRALLRRTKLDLAHHLTFGTYWLPTFVPFLGIPFIWGPLGGAESVPRKLGYGFGFYGQVFEGIRDLVRSFSNLSPIIRYTARNAAGVLAKSADTAAQLRELGAREVQVCQPGISVTDFPEVDNTESEERGFRIISVGRLLHWKGFHLSLNAYAEAMKRTPDMEYWIIGDGPERHRLEFLANKLGVGNQTHFWGEVSRHQALQKISSCDTLIHPSLHDSGGWVCLEAMALGKPVVCLDLGGPSLQVTPSTGFKIPANDPMQIIAELAKAMTTLATEPALRSQLGTAGRERILRRFSWSRKAIALSRIYMDSSRTHCK